MEENRMGFRLLVLTLLIIGGATAASAQSRWQSCLPEDVKADEVIAIEPNLKGGAGRQITVNDKLKQLRAKCRGQKLVDPKGRQIHFYRLTGCWGNPPENYQEIMENQQKELAQLRRRYNVVEISCNPSGLMVQ
jgi:hypothetical protein